MNRSALTALLAAALAASCAAPLKIDESVDPLAILEPGAIVYARVSGETARDLAPALLGPERAASAKRLLERTKVVALCMGTALPAREEPELAPVPEPKSSVPEAKLSKTPIFQAALLGDYPFRAASLSLGSDPDWKLEKPAYYNAKLGIYAAVPGPRLVLASSRPLESLIAAAKRPGASPIPQRLAELSSKPLVLWAPRPFASLAAALVGEPMNLPLRGLLVSASPAAGGADRYEATVVFMMEDEKALKTYKGILKLAWYGMAEYLFADEAAAAIALPVRADGELLVVSGLSLSRQTIAKALAALREGGQDLH